MAQVRILKQNYLDPDVLLSQSVTSALAIAPATNILAKTRRTKTWRSAGYWAITSSNKDIKFKETSGGSVLTASIVEANYTTDASFLTAIKTAMDLAGDSTYTVTRDTTTLKIKITSNGGGGAGDFQLTLSDSGFTAKTILGFSGSSDLTGALNYTADILKIHTHERFIWDLGTASNVQAFIAVGLRNEGIQLSSSAVVKLQGNETDVWTAPTFEETVDWHEDALSLFDSEGFHSGGLRYWSLLIEDPSNSDGYVELSNVYLGEIYQSTRGAVQFPFETDHDDLSSVEQSETGVNFSNVEQQTERYSIRWYGLTKQEKEELEELFAIYGKAYPFFISLDPESVFSTDSNRWNKYVRFRDDPRYRLESPNNFSYTWNLREEL